jgi:hypothetical protein
MAYKLVWRDGSDRGQDGSGSISELAGAVGLLYMALLVMGLAVVELGLMSGAVLPGGLAMPATDAVVSCAGPVWHP